MTRPNCLPCQERRKDEETRLLVLPSSTAPIVGGFGGVDRLTARVLDVVKSLFNLQAAQFTAIRSVALPIIWTEGGSQNCVHVGFVCIPVPLTTREGHVGLV